MNKHQNQAGSSTKQRLENNKGTTLLEYMFVAMLIFVVCVLGVSQLGTKTVATYEDPELINALQ